MILEGVKNILQAKNEMFIYSPHSYWQTLHFYCLHFNLVVLKPRVWHRATAVGAWATRRKNMEWNKIDWIHKKTKVCWYSFADLCFTKIQLAFFFIYLFLMIDIKNGGAGVRTLFGSAWQCCKEGLGTALTECHCRFVIFKVTLEFKGKPGKCVSH